MRPGLWKLTEALLLALGAIGLGVLLGTALRTQFLFFPTPIVGTARQVVTLAANLLCLVPLLAVLASAAIARRVGWQPLALAFTLPFSLAFAAITLS